MSDAGVSRTIAAVSLLFALSLASIAQEPQPAPSQPPSPDPPRDASGPTGRVDRARERFRSRTGFPAGSSVSANALTLRQIIIQKYAEPLYRKPTQNELLRVAPPRLLADKYSAFLSQPGTGITRLLADKGCGTNDKVLNVSEDCVVYTMPGAGNSFSFRTGNYRINRLADITFSKGMFSIPGILMHGAMTNLGDVPIENLSLASNGIAFLADLKPAADIRAALDLDKLLRLGQRRDNFLYSRAMPAILNHTYVIRAVAYRGRVIRSVHGAPYNELDFDKRRDIIVAFRVIDVSADGSVVIVWKQLRSLGSPRLKLPESGKHESYDVSA